MTAPSAKLLLAWYARHQRRLPWRSAPGTTAEPYHVWLSEIMLQQTVAATVIPYYAKFLAAYPEITDLAAAPLDEVLGNWAGLGYYARARNLHACAQAVAAEGVFPKDIARLRALPGIGPYTANAIGAIAFSLPVLPVDGNIERVTARIFALTAPLPAARAAIAKAAGRFMNDAAARRAPGDFAQALFDLGATICTPKNPKCGICPWNSRCEGRKRGIAAALPAREKKPERPRRHAQAYVLLDSADQVLLHRRPPKGLLGGMLVLPDAAPMPLDWLDAGTIQHLFTHFALTLSVKAARVEALPSGALQAPAGLAPLPSVMRKALDAGRAALNHQV